MVMTDIVDSTRLWALHSAEMAHDLAYGLAKRAYRLDEA